MPSNDDVLGISNKVTPRLLSVSLLSTVSLPLLPSALVRPGAPCQDGHVAISGSNPLALHHHHHSHHQQHTAASMCDATVPPLGQVVWLATA